MILKYIFIIADKNILNQYNLIFLPTYAFVSKPDHIVLLQFPVRYALRFSHFLFNLAIFAYHIYHSIVFFVISRNVNKVFLFPLFLSTQLFLLLY